MEKIEVVDKLRNKTNVSYEEAKKALENNNWDILDAMLYLEDHGIVKKPSVSIFYTNEYKENYTSEREIVNITEDEKNNNSKSKNKLDGIFESICKVIDTCNNIFLEIRRNDIVLLKLPLTVLIVLLFFAFWIIIPLMIVGLFFNIEFLVSAKKVNTDKMDKVNKVFSEISKSVQSIKRKFT